MNELQTLLQEREALENRIRQARQEQIAQAVATCRKLIDEHELSVTDLFGSGRGRGKKAGTGSKVAPKYRDPATGQTWCGMWAISTAVPIPSVAVCSPCRGA